MVWKHAPYKYYYPKYKIILGDVMEIKRDERRLDFHDIGTAIKRVRESKGHDTGATGFYHWPWCTIKTMVSTRASTFSISWWRCLTYRRTSFKQKFQGWKCIYIFIPEYPKHHILFYIIFAQNYAKNIHSLALSIKY